MIKETHVLVNPSYNKKHYESLGYKFNPKEEIEVLVAHLPIKSGVLVTNICDGCGKERVSKFHKTRNLCRQCSDIEKQKRHRESDSYKKLHYCECGNKKSPPSEKCQSCWTKSNTGELHHSWKGGVGRGILQYKWARRVKENYNHICDCCGYDRESSLEAHHYELRESRNSQEYTDDNGVALCSNCHKEFHKTYGYGDNNYEQYKEFKRSF